MAPEQARGVAGDLLRIVEDRNSDAAEANRDPDGVMRNRKIRERVARYANQGIKKEYAEIIAEADGQTARATSKAFRRM